MTNIFVTGATGFIGRRLIFSLLDQGHRVFALVRIRGTELGFIDHPNLHVLYGDLRDPEKMDRPPQNIHAAYYLVHSMAEKLQNLLEQEEQTARNFVDIVNETSCQQIIYLGGIIESGAKLSAHLLSRKNVEAVLQTSQCPVTVLRASIIIGAGSASFEIIRDLVEKLPIMIAPRWVRSLCQPIAITDVLFYLTASLLKVEMYHQTYDIGGPEVLSFKDVLLRYAAFRKLRRWILDIPLLTPRLSSYWLVFITSVRFSLCSYLVESMKYNSSCQEKRIQEVLWHTCLTFEDALQRAFYQIAQNEVISTWMDAWLIDEKDPDIRRYIAIPTEGCFQDVQKVSLTAPKAVVIERVWSLGGAKGWYGLDWAWQFRGLIDKFFRGTGMNRGRRHPTEILVGDSIDFWRVVKADRAEGHLILYAEMKLPGEAWFEFSVTDGQLLQRAVFRPRGVLGRLYWYCVSPFHFLIFRTMARRLAR